MPLAVVILVVLIIGMLGIIAEVALMSWMTGMPKGERRVPSALAWLTRRLFG